MRFILITVNTKNHEVQVDKEFPSMDELKEYVLINFHFTSLVITVLPA